MDIVKMKQFICFDPETGQMTWKKVLSNRTSPGSECGGNVDSKGYRRVCFDGKQYRAHRVAWALYYGEETKKQIDHINGNRLDNRIKNLRTASNAENSRNCKLGVNNTSGVKGVTWHQKANKWLAQICVNRKNKYLGIFSCKKDAEKARKAAEKEFFGVYSRKMA